MAASRLGRARRSLPLPGSLASNTAPRAYSIGCERIRAPPHVIKSRTCTRPSNQLAVVPIEGLRDTIPIAGSGAQFSPIRFLLTGATQPQRPDRNVRASRR